MTDYVAADGSNNVAGSVDIQEMAGLQAAMTSPSFEVAAAEECHGVIHPFIAYIELYTVSARVEHVSVSVSVSVRKENGSRAEHVRAMVSDVTRIASSRVIRARHMAWRNDLRTGGSETAPEPVLSSSNGQRAKGPSGHRKSCRLVGLDVGTV